jgi:outer membrane protein assembly factor BamA
MSLPVRILCCSLLLMLSLQGRAQIIQKAENNFLTLSGKPAASIDSLTRLPIRSITIKGNRRTKMYIIQRELHFKTGDSLTAGTLEKELEQGRRQVYNTTLFDLVKIDAVVLDNNELDIAVQLREKWYLYPTPQIQLADRNFNEWWDTYKRSFSRINYGIKFTQYNLSGRRDVLRIVLINGYSRNISIGYSNPYSNKKLTDGFAIGAGYSQNREVPYMVNTSSRIDSLNRLLFYPRIAKGQKWEPGVFVRNSWYLSAGYSIRRGLFRRHNITAAYSFVKVDDSVIIKNPNYFNLNKNAAHLFDLGYVYQYTDLDNVTNPLSGITGYFSISKRGFEWKGGVNMLTLEGSFNRYWNAGRGWYLNSQLWGRIRLPFDQPYINQRGLGYGENYLRGTEYYVIDGVATALFKTTLRKKIVSFNVPFRWFPRLTNRIPFTIYAKTYFDMGYAYNKKQYSSYLNNRFLYSGGIGIDIVSLYDFTGKIEFSGNQLGRFGRFIHTQNGF